MHDLAVPDSRAIALPTSPETMVDRRFEARKPQRRKSRERHLALSDMARTEIVPRPRFLPPVPAGKPVRSAPELDADRIAAFAVLGRDIAPVFEACTRLLTEGYATDELIVALLAPSVALLGRLREEDLYDLIEVTAGLARLQIFLVTYQTDHSSEHRCIPMQRHG